MSDFELEPPEQTSVASKLVQNDTTRRPSSGRVRQAPRGFSPPPLSKTPSGLPSTPQHQATLPTKIFKNTLPASLLQTALKADDTPSTSRGMRAVSVNVTSDRRKSVQTIDAEGSSVRPMHSVRQRKGNFSRFSPEPVVSKKFFERKQFEKFLGKQLPPNGNFRHMLEDLKKIAHDMGPADFVLPASFKKEGSEQKRVSNDGISPKTKEDKQETHKQQSGQMPSSTPAGSFPRSSTVPPPETTRADSRKRKQSGPRKYTPEEEGKKDKEVVVKEERDEKEGPPPAKKSDRRKSETKKELTKEENKEKKKERIGTRLSRKSTLDEADGSSPSLPADEPTLPFPVNPVLPAKVGRRGRSSIAKPVLTDEIKNEVKVEVDEAKQNEEKEKNDTKAETSDDQSEVAKVEQDEEQGEESEMDETIVRQEESVDTPKRKRGRPPGPSSQSRAEPASLSPSQLRRSSRSSIPSAKVSSPVFSHPIRARLSQGAPPSASLLPPPPPMVMADPSSALGILQLISMQKSKFAISVRSPSPETAKLDLASPPPTHPNPLPVVIGPNGEIIEKRGRGRPPKKKKLIETAIEDTPTASEINDTITTTDASIEEQQHSPKEEEPSNDGDVKEDEGEFQPALIIDERNEEEEVKEQPQLKSLTPVPVVPSETVHSPQPPSSPIPSPKTNCSSSHSLLSPKASLPSPVPSSDSIPVSAPSPTPLLADFPPTPIDKEQSLPLTSPKLISPKKNEEVFPDETRSSSRRNVHRPARYSDYEVFPSVIKTLPLGRRNEGRRKSAVNGEGTPDREYDKKKTAVQAVLSTSSPVAAIETPAPPVDQPRISPLRIPRSIIQQALSQQAKEICRPVEKNLPKKIPTPPKPPKYVQPKRKDLGNIRLSNNFVENLTFAVGETMDKILAEICQDGFIAPVTNREKKLRQREKALQYATRKRNEQIAVHGGPLPKRKFVALGPSLLEERTRRVRVPRGDPNFEWEKPAVRAITRQQTPRLSLTIPRLLPVAPPPPPPKKASITIVDRIIREETKKESDHEEEPAPDGMTIADLLSAKMAQGLSESNREDFFYHELFMNDENAVGSEDEADIGSNSVQDIPVEDLDGIDLPLENEQLARRICELVPRPNPQEEDAEWSIGDITQACANEPEQRRVLISRVLCIISSQIAADRTVRTREGALTKGGADISHNTHTHTAHRLRDALLIFSEERRNLSLWVNKTLLSLLPLPLLTVYLNLLRYLRSHSPRLVTVLVKHLQPETDSGDGWGEVFSLVDSFVRLKPADPNNTLLTNTLQERVMKDVHLVLVPPSVTAEDYNAKPKVHEFIFKLLRYLSYDNDHMRLVVPEGDITVAEALDSAVELVLAKVRNAVKNARNKRVVLVGWGMSCYINHRVAQLTHGISAIVDLAFPLCTPDGPRGTADDDILLTYCPSLFVMGAEAPDFNPVTMFHLRESMIQQSGLIVIGSADANLCVSTHRLNQEKITQRVAQRIIVELIADFLRLDGIRIDKSQLVPPPLNNVFAVDANTIRAAAEPPASISRRKLSEEQAAASVRRASEEAAKRKRRRESLDSIPPNLGARQPPTFAPQPKRMREEMPPLSIPTSSLFRPSFGTSSPLLSPLVRTPSSAGVQPSPAGPSPVSAPVPLDPASISLN